MKSGARRSERSEPGLGSSTRKVSRSARSTTTTTTTTTTSSTVRSPASAWMRARSGAPPQELAAVTAQLAERTASCEADATRLEELGGA